jgi:hypothetical protein
MKRQKKNPKWMKPTQRNPKSIRNKVVTMKRF